MNENINVVNKELYTSILNTFCQYNTVYTARKIEELLVSWGTALVEIGLHSHPRAVARMFWQKLMGMDFIPTKYERLHDQNYTVRHPNPPLFNVDIWVQKLMDCQIDEAVEAFTLAVYEWLHQCDLTMYMKGDNTELDAMLGIPKGWFYSWIH